jgi:hypothetical protein
VKRRCVKVLGTVLALQTNALGLSLGSGNLAPGIADRQEPSLAHMSRNDLVAAISRFRLCSFIVVNGSGKATEMFP